MGVVGSLIPGAGQAQHIGGYCLRSGVGWPATPIAVGKGGCSLLPVCRQQPSSVAYTHSNNRGRLICRYLFREQAVEHLQSSLFFLRQRQCLHHEDIFAGQLVRT